MKSDTSCARRAACFAVGLILALPVLVYGVGGAAAAEDDGPAERIMFDSGADRGSVSDSVAVGATDRYVFGAAVGQTASVSITDESDIAVFTIFTPSGTALSAPGVREWSGTLPTGGDFGLEVAATESVTYTLSLQLTFDAPTEVPVPALEPPSQPVINPAVEVAPMVDQATTACDEAHAGVQAYTPDGGLLWCGSGQWWPLEFEGEITYVEDDRYPLHLGSSGPHVRFVQSLLVALGFDVGASEPDGYFGVDTYLAVFAWQLDSARPVTAAVTVEDMDAMRSQLEAGAASSAAAATGALPRSTLESVSVPSLCDHPAGTLVAGELPLAQDPSGGDPGYLSLGDQIVSVDLDADGTSEIAGVFHCSQGGVSWPDHVVLFHADLSFLADVDLVDVFTDVPVWRGRIETLEVVDGHFAVTAGVEIVGADQNRYEIRSFTIDVDQGDVVVDPGGSETDPGTDGPVPLVSPAPCVAGELAFGMEGHRDEIALYQLTLTNLGYDPGEIDGYFGSNTLDAAVAEITDNGTIADSNGTFVELFPDDGAILPPAFERLGIAC